MKKVLTSVALAAAALAACVGAQAGVLRTTISFDPVDTSTLMLPPLLLNGDEFYQAGLAGRTMYFDPFANSSTAPQGALVGALVDGSNPNFCADLGVVCPVNNPTNYMSLLNDGAVVFGSTDGFRFSVKSFSAAWVGDGQAMQATPGFVRLMGMLDGAFTTATFSLNGLDASGNLNFANINTGAFGNTEFDRVYAYGFACPPPGAGTGCSAFSTDRAQFALDDITIEHVPEPASLALLSVAGLAAFRAGRRRAV